MTKITDNNIHELVTTYLGNPNVLPAELRNISEWDVSNVTNMSSLFEEANQFNQPLNEWDVSKVTSMRNMFFNAKMFNQPLDKWDISKVTDMGNMFTFAGKFNQPLNDWKVSNVTNMRAMFDGASIFNQPLNKWNVSNVTNMEGMFRNAKNFNQPLNDWDVSKETNKNEMFWGAIVFDNKNTPGAPILPPPPPQECISTEEYNKCKNDNGEVRGLIMLDKIDRKDTVKLPNENTVCYSREELRKYIKSKKEHGETPISPYTRMEITDDWIEKNLREDQCVEKVDGGKKRKTRKTKGKTRKRQSKMRKGRK